MSIFGVILVCSFPHLDWIRGDNLYLLVFNSNGRKYGPEQLRIRVLFTQCMLLWIIRKFEQWPVQITGIVTGLSALRDQSKHFCPIWFFPRHAEQKLRSTELQEKEEEKEEKDIENLIRRNPKIKNCLIILDLKPFRSEVMGKNCASKEV